MRSLVLTASLALAFGPAGNREEPPEDWLKVGNSTWMSVDSLVDEDGGLSPDLDPRDSATLEEWFAMYDERIAPRLHEMPEEWVPCTPMITSDGFRSESMGIFEVAVLLAEVAIVATVSKATSGLRNLSASVLVSLDEVEPLRNGVPLPERALVDVPSVRLGERRICGDYSDSARDDYWPRIGDRLVVIGDWNKSAVVMSQGGGHQSSLLARVSDDGRLSWTFGDGPSTLGETKTRINELVKGGLFHATAALRALAPDSPRRHLLGEVWSRTVERGCRVTGLEALRDGGWSPTSDCAPEK